MMVETVQDPQHQAPHDDVVIGGASPTNNSSDTDDLGLDRAFVMSMVRIPFIAVIWVVLALVSHQIWAAVSPATTNFGPLVIICIGMIIAAVIDGWAFKVPNWCTLSLVVSGWYLGLLHSMNVHVDAGVGSFLGAFACTMIGFALLGWLLAIVGMGQGDVKMLMGFGSWLGAFFLFKDALSILLWSFAWGALIGGVFGIVMMLCRRKFKKNLSNFREIAKDMKVLVTVGPSQAAARSSERRPGWDRLPYGVPLCIGFLGHLGYLYYTNALPKLFMN
ncbi:MAG: A24 family peptidase [Zavarzinella sp.]